MRQALKTIASFRNESADPLEPGQAAAILARETLDAISLFFEKDASERGQSAIETPAT
jgi:hypothetical protein